MSQERDAKAKAIIVGGTTAAMAAAVVPVPVADAVAITSAQLAMLTALTALYGLKLDGRLLMSLLMVYGGAQAGVWFGSLLKAVPVLGTVGGAALQMTIAGTITAAMGLGMNNLLATGRPIDPESFRQATDQAKEEAARLAKDQEEAARTKAARDDVVRRKVGLRAASVSADTIEVTFDLKGLPRSRLRVTTRAGEELASASVSAGDSPHRFRSSALRSGATHVVLLECQDTVVSTTVTV